jgi:DNA-binding MarR family transcriptional regulator
MDSVKGREPWATSADGRALPTPALMGRLLKEVSRATADADLDGLRPSHFQLLAELPAEGLRISDLAERLRMTKQSCGEFVTTLAAGGQVEVMTPPRDRRARVVLRTAAGDRALEQFEELMASLEDGWRARVGPRRYASFRAVLIELVT